jgi:hypothetical protein
LARRSTAEASPSTPEWISIGIEVADSHEMVSSGTRDDRDGLWWLGYLTI